MANPKPVPGFVMDTVDEVMDLLGVLLMACSDLDDDYRRPALTTLQIVIESKLFPLSTKGQEGSFPRRDGS